MVFVFFFKQKTAYEMRISDWSSDVCSSDLGDEVLRCVARVLRASVREIDTPARYGGDEFAVVLAEADVRGARTVAERIRTRFLEERGEAAAAQHCTLSIGLAEADRLLIRSEARRVGKECVSTGRSRGSP